MAFKHMTSEVHDMTRLVRFNRLLAAGVAACGAALALIGAAQAGPPAPDVPSLIAVPDGNKVFLVGHAVGVQIYACSATASGFGWALVAPRATLYDDGGKPIVAHFAGPTWQAQDGSRVVGLVDRRITVDAAAIPWLRLAAASTSAGADGDRLAKTSFIQRIATTGGLAPAAAECNAATAGTTAEVPYTADYYFWKKTGA
jgi:hypothetical protein